MSTYLFDFDGTLVDSMPTYIGIMLNILEESGIEYDDSIVKIITPLGYRYTAEYFVERGLKMSVEDAVAKMRSAALDAYANTIGAKERVIESLRILRARGDDLNVLTASPHDMLDPCLKRLGIFDWFSNVWSCEDFGTTKSDPEIYKTVAKTLGVDVSDVIFIDDNYNADKTAKLAGMTVYGVYDKSSADAESEMRAVCDRYIMDFTELL